MKTYKTILCIPFLYLGYLYFGTLTFIDLEPDSMRLYSFYLGGVITTLQKMGLSFPYFFILPLFLIFHIVYYTLFQEAFEWVHVLMKSLIWRSRKACQYAGKYIFKYMLLHAGIAVLATVLFFLMLGRFQPTLQPYFSISYWIFLTLKITTLHSAVAILTQCLKLKKYHYADFFPLLCIVFLLSLDCIFKTSWLVSAISSHANMISIGIYLFISIVGLRLYLRILKKGDII